MAKAEKNPEEKFQSTEECEKEREKEAGEGWTEEEGTPSEMWKPEKGEMREGVFCSEFETQFGLGYRIGKVFDGRPGHVVLFGCFDLCDKMAEIEIGETVRLTYLGKIGKTHKYKVQHRDSTKTEKLVFASLLKSRKDSPF